MVQVMAVMLSDLTRLACSRRLIVGSNLNRTRPAQKETQGALIFCPLPTIRTPGTGYDKICECVRVNCLNCKMETRTIECVAFFYHEGAKGDDFIQKNKFRCCVDSSQWGSVVKLREHVR